MLLVNILESNECPCEEELLNINIDVQSRLTRVFALNYFRRDYKSADAFMKKLWMDLKSFQACLLDGYSHNFRLYVFGPSGF